MSNTASLAMTILACAQLSTHAAEIGQWEVFETSYETQKTYAKPFVDVEVNVVFSQGDKQWTVPAFWAGGSKWTVRFAPPVQGEYTFRVECTDKANADLNGNEQTLRVTAYTGDNPAAQARLSAGQRRQAALRARRRHAVLLAGRHVVEGPVQAADLGRLSGTDGRPQGQGLHASCRSSAASIPTKACSSRAGRTRAESRT